MVLIITILTQSLRLPPPKADALVGKIWAVRVPFLLLTSPYETLHWFYLLLPSQRVLPSMGDQGDDRLVWKPAALREAPINELMGYSPGVPAGTQSFCGGPSLLIPYT